MAMVYLSFLKCSPGVIFLRLLNQEKFLQKSACLSTSKLLCDNAPIKHIKNATPIKYTTNKAFKANIAQTIGLDDGDEAKTAPYDYTYYILTGSLAIFLIYFCILREENDIDEILKGNSQLNKSKEIVDLKIKIKYCELNHLPADALRKKLEELEKDIKIPSPFIK